ncbi:MAG TPA: DUF5615 family PIN-like protein [Chloroflexota bacterium]
MDERVPRELERLLIADGHTVFHAKDVAKGAGDARQFVQALNRQAVLVTQNVGDFRLLQQAWRLWSGVWGVRTQHKGIIGLPKDSAANWRDAIRLLIHNRQPFDNEMFQ